MEAFDLNAISSGSNLAFGVDDSLSGVSTAAIGTYLHGLNKCLFGRIPFACINLHL